VLRLTEDASFRRRVMAETGTQTPSTIGTPLLLLLSHIGDPC
jgi:hypothetical protein